MPCTIEVLCCIKMYHSYFYLFITKIHLSLIIFSPSLISWQRLWNIYIHNTCILYIMSMNQVVSKLLFVVFCHLHFCGVVFLSDNPCTARCSYYDVSSLLSGLVSLITTIFYSLWFVFDWAGKIVWLDYEKQF